MLVLNLIKSCYLIGPKNMSGYQRVKIELGFTLAHDVLQVDFSSVFQVYSCLSIQMDNETRKSQVEALKRIISGN